MTTGMTVAASASWAEAMRGSISVPEVIVLLRVVKSPSKWEKFTL
jgi:hypothetical protein